MDEAIRIMSPGEICARYPAKISASKLYITPEALKQIAASIGSRRPETGAKMFGPLNKHGVDLVEFDRLGSAKAGSTIYRPDVRWGIKRVKYHLHEASNTRLWTGDVHSHPSRIGRPSGEAGPGEGDLGYARAVFDENPWMLDYYIPIVTDPLDDPTLWSWVVHRDDPTTALVAEVVVTSVDDFPERRVTKDYAGNDGKRQAVEVPGPPEKPAGPMPDFDLPPPLRPLTLSQVDYRKRLSGVVSEGFGNKHIAVVGVGAASTMTEVLVRHGVSKATIFDPDIVEFGNLCRTAYSLDDIDRPKVEALASKLRSVNPFVTIQPIQADFCAVEEAQLDAAIGDADLLIAATDQLDAQASVNTAAIRLGKPAIFIDIHAGGRGGMIVWTVPGKNACYRCIAARRFKLQAVTELPAERASMVDIGFIDHIAMKLALALLDRGQDSAMGRFFEQLDLIRNQVVVRTDPSYSWDEVDIFDAVIADLTEQQQREIKDEAFFALDSIWLKAEPVFGCPACGGRGAQP